MEIKNTIDSQDHLRPCFPLESWIVIWDFLNEKRKDAVAKILESSPNRFEIPENQ